MNTNSIPLSLAVWLLADDYDRSDEPNTISATTLLKPVKSVILSSRVQQEPSTTKDIMSLLPSRLGTAIHTAIEAAWLDTTKVKNIMLKLGYPKSMVERVVLNPTSPKEGDLCIYTEIRSDRKIGDFTVTGKFDFVTDGVLEDFKTTGVMSWIKQTNAEKYIQQGSIYRWLNPDIIREDYMYIEYLFTDWSATQAKQDPTYPNARIISQKYKLMSLQETESFIKLKLSEISKYLTANQDAMPQCTPEEVWQKPAVYKYYKNPEKMTRSTANFPTYQEAYQRYANDGGVGKIITIPGEVVFCRYCNGRTNCNQAKQYIQEGLLNVD
jgi:hypothetical protein